MKTCIPTLLVLAFASFCAADEPATEIPPKTDTGISVADFQYGGVWKPKGAMLSGTLLPPPALDAIALTLTDESYEVTVTGEDHPDKGIYMLDETVSPMRMAIKSTSGPNQGRIILAIYEIKGKDAMRVCYDLSGSSFPKEFKAPKGSGLYLAGYRRQKPESSDNQRSGPKQDRGKVFDEE